MANGLRLYQSGCAKREVGAGFVVRLSDAQTKHCANVGVA